MLAHTPGYDLLERLPRGAYFDGDQALDAIDFFGHPRHSLLHFIEGERAGQPFTLEPWQRAFVAAIYGLRMADGRRLIRKALLYVAAKNGKTPLLSGISLREFVGSTDAGFQGFWAAADREQAALAFRHARFMVEAEPLLAERIRVYGSISMRSLVMRANEACTFRVLSSDARLKAGLTANFVGIDELWAHPNRELVDQLETRISARAEPLIVYTTTADFEREGSICNEILQYARGVRDGGIDNPRFLSFIYEAPRDCEWTDPAVWRLANPNLGVSKKAEYMDERCAEARANPGVLGSFLREDLNICTGVANPWLNPLDWAACAADMTYAEFEQTLQGQKCWGGLDLSSKVDLTAWALVFPPLVDGGEWAVLARFFLPDGNARELGHQHGVDYVAWARAGWITLTPGMRIEYARLAEQIRRDLDSFQVQDIGVDPHIFEALRQQWIAEGFPEELFVEFAQTIRNFSEPMKELAALVREHKLRHGKHPVLKWNAESTYAYVDGNENVRPSKKSSKGRIDGVVAAIMALGRCMYSGESESYYATHELEGW